MATPPLLTLPDELLLKVCYFASERDPDQPNEEYPVAGINAGEWESKFGIDGRSGRKRRRLQAHPHAELQHTISKISQVCRRLRPVALGVLLKHPIVHHDKLPSFVCMIVAWTELAVKTHTLEIESPRVEDKTSWDTYDQPRVLPTEFTALCLNYACRKSNWPANTAIAFQKDLKDGCVGAYFAIIFAQLSGLKDLRLGRCCLYNLPFLTCLFPKSRHPRHWTTPLTYLAPIFDQVKAQLQVLSLTVDWRFPKTSNEMLRTPYLPRLSFFTSLQHVAIPLRSIHPICRRIYPSASALSNPSTALGVLLQKLQMFPPTLESLTLMVSCCSHCLGIAQDALVICKSSLPALRMIRYERSTDIFPDRWLMDEWDEKHPHPGIEVVEYRDEYTGTYWDVE